MGNGLPTGSPGNIPKENGIKGFSESGNTFLLEKLASPNQKHGQAVTFARVPLCHSVESLDWKAMDARVQRLGSNFFVLMQ